MTENVEAKGSAEASDDAKPEVTPEADRLLEVRDLAKYFDVSKPWLARMQHYTSRNEKAVIWSASTMVKKSYL